MAMEKALASASTMEFVPIEPGTFEMGTTGEQGVTAARKGMWEGGLNLLLEAVGTLVTDPAYPLEPVEAMER